MLKIRLHGDSEEVAKFIEWLESQNEEVKILNESEFYKDRGKSVYVRKYLDIDMKDWGRFYEGWICSC